MYDINRYSDHCRAPGKNSFALTLEIAEKVMEKAVVFKKLNKFISLFTFYKTFIIYFHTVKFLSKIFTLEIERNNRKLGDHQRVAYISLNKFNFNATAMRYTKQQQKYKQQ